MQSLEISGNYQPVVRGICKCFLYHSSNFVLEPARQSSTMVAWNEGKTSSVGAVFSPEPPELTQCHFKTPDLPAGPAAEEPFSRPPPVVLTPNAAGGPGECPKSSIHLHIHAVVSSRDISTPRNSPQPLYSPGLQYMEHQVTDHRQADGS